MVKSVVVGRGDLELAEGIPNEKKEFVHLKRYASFNDTYVS